MPREFSKTNFTMWTDPDFRALPFPAQHLYLVLWNSPAITYCGSMEWKPNRLQAVADGWDPWLINMSADCLRARHFVVVDDATEEAVVRSWVRFDGVLRNPTLAVSLAKAFAGLYSNDLRGVVVHELRKLREREPELAGWRKPVTAELLDNPVVDPRDLTVPADPFEGGYQVHLTTADGLAMGPFGGPFGGPAGGGVTPEATQSDRGSRQGSPTTTTATSTFQQNPPGDDEVAEPTDNGQKSRPKGRDEAGEREDVDRVVEALRASVIRRGVKPKVGRDWYTQARLLIDVDEYTPDQIVWLIEKLTVDEFWSTNVLSMSKLRKQADQLKIKFRGANTTTGGSAAPANWMRRPRTKPQTGDGAE